MDGFCPCALRESDRGLRRPGLSRPEWINSQPKPRFPTTDTKAFRLIDQVPVLLFFFVGFSFKVCTSECFFTAASVAAVLSALLDVLVVRDLGLMFKG
eukprot:1161846-Pelagomonas_calceolata.AAC.1